MVLMMLLPAKYKMEQQRKYWDFAALYELNELYHRGVSGVKVKVHGSTMDSPGRSELLGKWLGGGVRDVLMKMPKGLYTRWYTPSCV